MSLIPSAMAATTTGPASSPANGLSTILFLVVFFLVFYFLFMRPQQKRAKEQRQMLANLNKGDEIVTSGGLIGRISRIQDDFIVLELAEGLEVKVQRQAVSACLPKGTMKAI